jgi:hypothetical protein
MRARILVALVALAAILLRPAAGTPVAAPVDVQAPSLESVAGALTGDYIVTLDLGGAQAKPARVRERIR